MNTRELIKMLNVKYGLSFGTPTEILIEILSKKDREKLLSCMDKERQTIKRDSLISQTLMVNREISKHLKEEVSGRII
jgi:hypothetical protein